MAVGVRKLYATDYAVSVTGLAGPGGDEYGNPVGTVYVGFADKHKVFCRKYSFSGERDDVRNSAVCEALKLVLGEITQ